MITICEAAVKSVKSIAHRCRLTCSVYRQEQPGNSDRASYLTIRTLVFTIWRTLLLTLPMKSFLNPPVPLLPITTI
jgi:hypothetical protein